VGLVFHGCCIRFGWLRQLAVPIDRGFHFRGRPLFGANKTYRGVIAVAIGAAAGYALQAIIPGARPEVFRDFSALQASILGLAVGAAAMLSELPNSFAKRQLGIAPSASGSGLAAGVFYVVDQADFLLGAWFVLLVWVRPTLALVIASVVFVVVVHQLISVAGKALGMRVSAR
jgi:hypothetical protein